MILTIRNNFFLEYLSASCPPRGAVNKTVIVDVVVDKEENCFPMIQSGSAHNEMVLNKLQKQDKKSAEKGKVLV